MVREDSELLYAAFSKQLDLSKLLIDLVFLRMRNIIVTPHNTFNTREALQCILKTTHDNIEAFVSDGQTFNAVNVDKVKH